MTASVPAWVSCWPTWLALAGGIAAWPVPKRALRRWRALAGPPLVGPRPADVFPGAGRRRRRRPAGGGAVDDAAVRRAVLALRGELAAGARPGPALGASAAAVPELGRTLLVAAGAAESAGDVAAVLAAQPRLGGLAAAWRLSEDTGAPLERVLEGVANDLGQRVDQRRAVAAALAGPRTSGALLAALPLLGLLLAAGMGASPVAFLTGTATGRLVAAAGALLDAAGLAWIHRLARAAMPP